MLGTLWEGGPTYFCDQITMNSTQKAEHVSKLTGMTMANSHQWLCDNFKRIRRVRDDNGWSTREALNWTLQHS